MRYRSILFAIMIALGFALAAVADAQQGNTLAASLTPFCIDSTMTTHFPSTPYTPGQTFALPSGSGQFGFYLGGYGSYGTVYITPVMPTLGYATLCGYFVDVDYTQPGLVAFDTVTFDPSVCAVFPPCQTMRATYSAADTFAFSVQAYTQACAMSACFYLTH